MFTSSGRLSEHLTPIALQKLFALLLLGGLLIGCADTPYRPEAIQPADRPGQAAQAMALGDYGRAHTLYLQLADEHQPPESWRYRLHAAEALYHNGLFNQALQMLQELPARQLPSELALGHQLLVARIHLQRDPDLALSHLLRPAVDEHHLPGQPDLYAQYHQLRAQAFGRLGNHIESAREYILREIYLSDGAAIVDNQQAIWQALGMMTPQALRQLRIQPPPDALSGWMELAELARNYQLSPAELERLIAQWRQRYTGHPATAEFLAGLQHRSAELRTRPSEIAMLLPLSGRLAGAGRAIQDGILAAWFADPQRDSTRLRFIDVGDDPAHTLAHYQQAVSEGADFIIGPLDKAAVESLAQHEELPLPTLALNQAGWALSPQLYQFGLSPEDEAVASANRAWEDGYRHAALLVPTNALGERLAQAFAQRWQELGGTVIAERHYDPGQNDFAGPIKGLLNISDSELRYRRINLLSSRRVEFTPRLREDIDFLFLAAQPRQARLIRPQLRFHHAANLPVLATSHVYTGRPDRDADRDMDGILFPDTPWTLGADTLTSDLRKHNSTALAAHGNQLQRLVAMGVDAYQLVPLLEMLKSRPHEYYPGETGLLSIDGQGRISRQLQWARFQRGQPQLLHDEPGKQADVSTHTP